MRIISGKFKKKAIYPPKNFRARPTTDMAKEGLFNIIENHFDLTQIKALDLFAGTGSIGFELASRECPDVTCVELNYHHYMFIKKTVSQLKVEQQVKVIKSNAFHFLRKSTTPYHFIFADPPYDMKEFHELPELVFQQNLLTDDGWLIIEHPGEISFTSHPDFFKQSTYGSVNFSFFKKI